MERISRITSNSVWSPKPYAGIQACALFLGARARLQLAMCVLAFTFAIGVPTSALLALPPAYELTDLGEGTPYDIDNSGQVVGSKLFGTQWYSARAVLWSPSGITNMGGLGSASYAYQLNNSGVAVGRAITPLGGERSFRWQDGVFEDMNIGASLAHSRAMAISDSGLVVGHAGTHAYRWQNGTTEYAPFGTTASGSYAVDVNTTGTVVGWCWPRSSSGKAAFVWQGTALTYLPELAYGDTEAMAINDQGVIVGYSEIENGDRHAVIWNSGVIQDLGTLGGKQAVAANINESGVIVGSSLDSTGQWNAFLWDGSQMLTLADLVVNCDMLRFEGPASINDFGQIACKAYDGESQTWHAVLLTPVPEPATIMILALGGLVASRRR